MHQRAPFSQIPFPERLTFFAAVNESEGRAPACPSVSYGGYNSPALAHCCSCQAQALMGWTNPICFGSSLESTTVWNLIVLNVAVLLDRYGEAARSDPKMEPRRWEQPRRLSVSPRSPSICFSVSREGRHRRFSPRKLLPRELNPTHQATTAASNPEPC